MNSSTQESFVNSTQYFELTNTESIPNKRLYKKFINWVSGEFELFLQDNLHGLQIFFPGGWFNINEIETDKDAFEFEIVVKSKYEQKGIQINVQLKAILNHILKLKLTIFHD
tara:strand:+ start:19446 stop:19781 length:336 start_codon:yes stop_codon:yes gene_type:complete